jgi:hypothetical protein
MTQEQEATARRMFVFENRTEAQIAKALAVPFAEVLRFINGCDQWKTPQPERVSTTTIDRLESLVDGLNLARPRRPRRPMSDEQRAKLSAIMKGRAQAPRGPMSEETKARISAAKTGRAVSPAHRAALSEAWIRRRAAV